MEVSVQDTEEVVDFFKDLVEVVVSLFDWEDLGVDLFDSFGVCASGGVLAVVVQPLAVFFEKGQNGWNVLGLGVFFVTVGKVFLPFVQNGFEFVLSFVGFQDEFVLV